MFELKVYLCISNSNISSFISLRLPCRKQVTCTFTLYWYFKQRNQFTRISTCLASHCYNQLVRVVILNFLTYPFEVCIAKCCVNVKSWNHCCRRTMRFEKILYEYYYVSQYFLLLSQYDQFYLQLKIFGVRPTCTRCFERNLP